MLLLLLLERKVKRGNVMSFVLAMLYDGRSGTKHHDQYWWMVLVLLMVMIHGIGPLLLISRAKRCDVILCCLMLLLLLLLLVINGHDQCHWTCYLAERSEATLLLVNSIKNTNITPLNPHYIPLQTLHSSATLLLLLLLHHHHFHSLKVVPEAFESSCSSN
mmetsp:Transcript_9439/g.14190  ORF Transcript_9439/g.14190 Transcript_9439/m.14190 type:complete len:161 (+) Transcript_9439:613-1095(+)